MLCRLLTLRRFGRWSCLARVVGVGFDRTMVLLVGALLVVAGIIVCYFIIKKENELVRCC